MAVLLLAVGWARRNLVVVTVEGESMSPTYDDGDRVLVRRARAVPSAAGAVIVLAPPADPDAFVGRRRGREAGRLWFVKRLVAGPGDPVPAGLGPALTDAADTPVPAGAMVIVGDNPARSHDSRQEGFVAVDRVRGVVLRKL
ncbi:S26 family signal peptidase [Longispora sp. K20-0274]|uniref:S26 family signal peptidase n=1 Tax=Longispora sp. K20-0274 TaxID=3088255 RepID=UPI003999D991